MNVVVVFESIFRNTHAVADAIAEGIRLGDPTGEVRCLHVSEASPEVVKAAELLIVGGPTHMHGMSSAMTRKMGVKQETKATPDTSTGTEVEPEALSEGLRDWFHGIHPDAEGTAAAAFDTRADSHFAGAAAHGIARRLSSHGYGLVAPPEGFIVEDTTGPLREGELARAAAWGASLLTKVAEVGLPTPASNR